MKVVLQSIPDRQGHTIKFKQYREETKEWVDCWSISRLEPFEIECEVSDYGAYENEGTKRE